MSDDPNLPFGHNTLKLRAVFVPDGADVSTADTIRTVGPHPVMIPAVWVPEGGALPGYPYEHIGQAVFIPDSDNRDTPASISRQNPTRMSPSHASSLSAPSRTNDPHAREDNALDDRRWSGSPFGITAGPWAPAASGNASSGGLLPRRGVRSTQANFSAAVPTPHVDTSRDAIDAAVRALGVKPSDGIVPISADLTAAGLPVPQRGTAPSNIDADTADRRLQNARLQAMLRLIRSAENQDDGDRESDYHRLVGDPPGGSGSITSLDHHPGRTLHLNIRGKSIKSTAAGAYQITETTWRGAVKALETRGDRLTDFSVASQDKVATQIIRGQQALDLVLSGNLEQAVATLRGTWVSLPGGIQQAHRLDIGEARRRFDRYVTEYLTQTP